MTPPRSIKILSYFECFQGFWRFVGVQEPFQYFRGALRLCVAEILVQIHGDGAELWPKHRGVKFVFVSGAPPNPYVMVATAEMFQGTLSNPKPPTIFKAVWRVAWGGQPGTVETPLKRGSRSKY